MLRICYSKLKPKRPNLPHALREKVWTHYLGNLGEAPCFCCERIKITPFRFECAHIIADSKGGNSNVENLLPCCSGCNKSMGAMNFFVFKSKMHDNFHYNQRNLSELQKDIIKYYNHKEENLTCRDYLDNFNEWKNILSESLITRKKFNKNKKKDKKKDKEIIYKFKCNCGFKFSYITKKTKNNMDFALTCKESKQNLIDVICDHIPCLINKKEFINDTKNLNDFKEWKNIK
jgi:hypothetical protein